MLSERELNVLNAIVRRYILCASPTGSRFISKLPGFNLSSATIRNVMGDLEEKGFLTHPHKSAGRVPTDKGYRCYVDRMINNITLPQDIRREIEESVSHIDSSDLHTLLDATTNALSRVSNQLGFALAPKLKSAVFRHVDIYKVSSRHFVINLTIDSGFVKSLMIELETSVESKHVAVICNLLNDRFAGMTIDEISRLEYDAFRDAGSYNLEIVRLFIPSIKEMVIAGTEEEVYTDGETNILTKPEFFSRDKVGAVIEVLEEKKMLVHIIESGEISFGKVLVSIGGEIENGNFSSFGIVKTSYKVGNLEGRLGIIGPKRMEYPLLVAAVDYTAKTLQEKYSYT